MLQITTYSGAVYYVDGTKVTGGSRNLVDGKLVSPVRLRASMMIGTPERAHLFPDFDQPGLVTSHIVSIEEIDESEQTT